MTVLPEFVTTKLANSRICRCCTPRWLKISVRSPSTTPFDAFKRIPSKANSKKATYRNIMVFYDLIEKWTRTARSVLTIWRTSERTVFKSKPILDSEEVSVLPSRFIGLAGVPDAPIRFDIFVRHYCVITNGAYFLDNANVHTRKQLTQCIKTHELRLGNFFTNWSTSSKVKGSALKDKATTERTKVNQ